MDFVYSEFWDWWCAGADGACEDTHDVVVIQYRLAPGAVRYHSRGDGAPGPAARFLTDNMVAARVRDGDALYARAGPPQPAGPPLLEHGMFIVREANLEGVNARNRKKLFAVFPQLHRFHDHDALVADHFSFVVDHHQARQQAAQQQAQAQAQGASERGRRRTRKAAPLKLHLTRYVPDPLVPGHGFCPPPSNNYLPLRFTLPRHADGMRTGGQSALLTHDLLRRDAFAWPLHALLARHMTPPGEGGTRPPSGQTGGARPAARGRRAAQRRPPPQEFGDLWLSLPLQSALVIAVRRAGDGADGRYDATVLLRSRLREDPPGRRSPRPALLLPRLRLADPGSPSACDAAFQAALLPRLAQMRWDDFEAVSDSSEDRSV